MSDEMKMILKQMQSRRNFMETARERSKVIYIAKGIGILLVVWAHARGPLSNYINQFHMPFSL